ncbi:MAG: fibronectin type III domain-containing protein, partial [Patescibacteria group bacterium]|nr:fibronectin type III domain-containing protein [Patescibacteria group bacterium]
MQLNANSPKFLLAVLILAGLSLVYTITATVPVNQSTNQVRVLTTVAPRTQLAQVSGSSCTTGDLTCGLVGWWKLDDGSGTTASDSSGSGNNGTISGSPLPTWTAGEIGGALGFSGGTGNIRVSNISLNTGTYTICTWENAPAIAAYQTDAIGYRWPFQLYLTSVDGKTLRAMFSNNSGTYAHSGNDMAPNAWNHLCLIRNSDNTVSFYVNGALSGAANQFAGTTTAPMSAGYIIGGRADGTNVSAMTGSLDDYRIYNRALAPSEIQSLYSGATSGTGSTPTAPAISGVSISNVTSSGATVSWTTDIPADSQVLYGLTQNYGSQTAVDSTLVTSHSVQLTGLLSGTQYDFEVKSSASGLSSASGNNLLTTAAASTPVTPPPPPPPPPATSVDTGPLIGGIIDPSRAMDWSGAGIPGGIPHYTTICQTVAPSGLTDATDMNAIDSAIAACGAAYKSTGVGQVVQLQAGTYTVTNGLTFGPNTGVSGVVLRGAGPDQTKLVFTGSNPCNGTYSNICVMGSKGWGGNYLDFGGGSATWTGGYAKGSSVITVGSTAGLSVGQVIILDQRNDAIGIVASPNGASESGTTATITTTIPHGFKVGQCVGIGDVSGSYS